MRRLMASMIYVLLVTPAVGMAAEFQVDESHDQGSERDRQ